MSRGGDGPSETDTTRGDGWVFERGRNMGQRTFE